jgi:hypothetical protein
MAEDRRPGLPGWSRQAIGIARRLPGFGLAERLVDPLLGQLDGRARGDTDVAPEAEADADTQPKTAATLMNQLLERSMFQTPAESLEILASRVVEEIVPDEARIVAALADGHSYPLLHVEAGARSRAMRRVLSNASSVGRAAGVALPGDTPAYLSHLFALGLIEEGPQDAAMTDEYSILSTDDTVRRALEEAREAGLKSHRLMKRTVQLSPLGRRLWAVWRP